MPSRPVLFIDDGGVLHDNAVRAPIWQAEIGRFLAAELDGDPEMWTAANNAAFPAAWKLYAGTQIRPGETGTGRYRDFLAKLTRGTHEFAGREPPPRETAIELGYRLAGSFTLRPGGSMPGAREAVLALAAAGFTLHTASGGVSSELEGILRSLGVRQAFSNLYGPDLVDRVKLDPGYYDRIFAHAGVDPAGAIVVDSDEPCAEWAQAAGATAFVIPRDFADFAAFAAATLERHPPD